MKKIVALSLILIVLSFAASAQGGFGKGFRKHRLERGFNSGQINRPERMELRKDALRYEMLERKTRRDGVVTPFERKRLRKAKCEDRRDLFRAKHNRRRRMI